jgi:hypothetical protein
MLKAAVMLPVNANDLAREDLNTDASERHANMHRKMKCILHLSKIAPSEPSEKTTGAKFQTRKMSGKSETAVNMPEDNTAAKVNQREQLLVVGSVVFYFVASLALGMQLTWKFLDSLRCMRLPALSG